MARELGQFFSMVDGQGPVRVELKTVTEFTGIYLNEINRVKRDNDQHPLIYYILSINRWSPVSSPIAKACRSIGATASIGSLMREMDYQGWVIEMVEKPLDYADDYLIRPYHWRRSTLEESISRSIQNVRAKLRGDIENRRLAALLASFYLQLSTSLYGHEVTFMEMAAADVFHSRGVDYAVKAINLDWDRWASDKGYDVSGFYYPGGKFAMTPEYESFFNPKMAALEWFNVPASQAWQRMQQRSTLSRDRRISELIARDRFERAHAFRNLLIDQVDTMDQARTILAQSGLLV